MKQATTRRSDVNGDPDPRRVLVAGVLVIFPVVLLLAVPMVALADPYRLFVSQIGYNTEMPQWALIRPSVDTDPNLINDPRYNDPNDPNTLGDPNLHVAIWPDYLDLSKSVARVEVYADNGDGTYTKDPNDLTATITGSIKTYQVELYRVEWDSNDLPQKGMLNVCVGLYSVFGANEPFQTPNAAAPIGVDHLFQETWRDLAFDEAEAREANYPDEDGGWYDDSGPHGEPVKIALYTMGFAELLLHRSETLTSTERDSVSRWLRWGADYLILLQGYPDERFEPNQFLPGPPTRDGGEQLFYNVF